MQFSKHNGIGLVLDKLRMSLCDRLFKCPQWPCSKYDISWFDVTQHWTALSNQTCVSRHYRVEPCNVSSKVYCTIRSIINVCLFHEVTLRFLESCREAQWVVPSHHFWLLHPIPGQSIQKWAEWWSIGGPEWTDSKQLKKITLCARL